MSVTNGQKADQTTFNNAFVSRTVDTGTLGKLALNNADAASGTAVTNSQAEHNSAASFIGKAINAARNALPAWTSSVVGSASDSLFTRLNLITARFNSSTGHAHDGTQGGGAPIASISLSGTPLQGYYQLGENSAAITGASLDASSLFAAKQASSGPGVVGVPDSAPYNRVIIRAYGGTNHGQTLRDDAGYEIYGRLTNSGPTWTLSFYSAPSQVETAYTFVAPASLSWYYQELFNPLSNPPIYMETGFIGGGGGSGGAVGYQEALSGTANGVNSIFGPLSRTPSSGESVIVFVDYVAMPKSAWTLSGQSIVFSAGNIPQVGQTVYAFFLASGTTTAQALTSAPVVEYREVSAGEIDDKQMTLAQTPGNSTVVMVDLIGGSAQRLSVDYSVAGATLGWSGLGLDGLLEAGDVLRVHYFT